jgi:DNA polymerase/3'-5' exonuclease PolX
MKLKDAQLIAKDLLEKASPLCERIEIAGSIRRKKPDVKDIEIVAIPKWTESRDPSDLFGERKPRINQLWLNLSFRIDVVWIKPGTSEIVPWDVKPDGKYWRGLLPEGIKLDLFIASQENFGAIYLIRTGSAEFSAAVMAHAKRLNRRCVDGYFTRDGERVITPEEKDVFDLLNLEFVEPELRIGRDALKSKRPEARPRCKNDDHDFKEEYYGWQCQNCDAFYAFGNEPWIDYEPDPDDFCPSCGKE